MLTRDVGRGTCCVQDDQYQVSARRDGHDHEDNDVEFGKDDCSVCWAERDMEWVE